MQYAQLGSIIFETITGFDSFDSDRPAKFVRFERLQSKPITHAISLDLETITIAIKLHADFCNPRASIAALVKAQEAQAPMAFFMANGEVRGEFVIENLRETWTQTDPMGNILAATVSLTLTEHVEVDKDAAKQRAARAAAKALSGAKIPASARVSGNSALLNNPTLTPPGLTVANTMSAVGKAMKTINAIGKVAADPSRMRAIAKDMKAIDPKLAQVSAALDSGAPVYDSVKTIKSTCNRMRDLCATARTAAEAKNPAALSALSREMLSATRAFNRGMAPLAVQVAARKA